MCCFKASLSSPPLRATGKFGTTRESLSGLSGNGWDAKISRLVSERGGVANDSAAGKLISDGSGDSTRR